MPPVPDVVATPRSGRVLSQRVAIHCRIRRRAGRPRRPAPPANPALNAWLAIQLPDPDEIAIGFRVDRGGSVS